MNNLLKIDIENDLLPVEKKLDPQNQKAKEVLRLFREKQKTPIIYIQHIPAKDIKPSF